MASAGASVPSVLDGGVDQGRIQRLRNMIPSKTVTEIKGIIRDLTAKTGVRLGMTGNKPVLINRLNEQLDSWMQANNWNRIRTMITLVEALRDTKGFMLEMPAAGASSSATNGHGPTATHTPTNWDSTTRPAAVQLQRSDSNYGLGNVPPNKALSARTSSGYVGQQGTSSAVRVAPTTSRIAFKPSPFWKIESYLCPPVIVPEASMQTRKEATLDLKLNPQVASLIKSQSASYQVRLFCTTKAHADMSERYGPAPIEFPVTCELRINSNAYSSNLKGSKKSPGRVPPPNLNKDKTLYTREGLVNKIQLVYANTNQKYIMVAAMCSYTSVEDIVTNLRLTKYKDREEIIGSMKRAAAEEDIEIGTSTLSLRDPLSYTRIQAPCRSIHCSHSQCFDATYFFMSNEQSPTWTCPHCSKLLQPEDLFIDGYFEDIVKRVPEDEDAVEFEQDGSWRTKDGRVSSSSDGVAAAPPPSAAAGPAQNGTHVDSPVPVKGEVGSSSPGLPPAASGSETREGATNGHAPEIVLLDDTPSPPPSRPSTGTVAAAASAPRSPAMNGNGQAANGARAAETIDLTFSDSEDEDVQPVTRAASTTAAASSTSQQRQATGVDPSGPAASRHGPSSGTGPRTFFEPRSTLPVPSPTFAHPRPHVNGQQYGTTSPSLASAPVYRPGGGSAQLTDFFQPHVGSSSSTSSRSAGGSSPTYAAGNSPRLFNPVVGDRSASASAGPASAGATGGYNFWPPRRPHSTSEQSSNATNGVNRAPPPVVSVAIRPREDDPLEGGEQSRYSPNGQPANKRPRRQESAEADGGDATRTASAQQGTTAAAGSNGHSASGGVVSDTEEEGELSSSPPPTRSARRRGPIPIVDIDDSIDSPIGAGRGVQDEEEEEEGELPRRPHRNPHRIQRVSTDEEDTGGPQSGSGPATTGTTTSQQTRHSDWDDYDELIDDGNDSLFANLPDGA